MCRDAIDGEEDMISKNKPKKEKREKKIKRDETERKEEIDIPQIIINKHTKECGVVVGRDGELYNVIVLSSGINKEEFIKCEKWYKSDTENYFKYDKFSYSEVCQEVHVNNELDSWCERINDLVKDGKKYGQIKELLQ